jgi:glycosyltransferase involved in cell wall biosynthesis
VKIWFPTIRGGSGTDIYTERLAAALNRRRIETVITWFALKYEFAPFLLLRAKAPSGTDIIHANSWSGFAFKRSQIPLVITEHHCVFDPAYKPHKTILQHLYHNFWIKPFVLRTFRAADAVTTVSNYTALSLQRAFGIQSSIVIPNWVDTELFKPLVQSEAGCPFRLLYVGNLSRRKGSDLLAPIMTKLGHGFQLSYTTGLRPPPPAGRLKHGDTPNMQSIGRLDSASALIQAYHRCDALLFPSRFEGFGLAPLEAMACGKPVVTSNNSALPEVVDNRSTGILCPTDDVSAFVEACLFLKKYPEIREAYALAARDRAQRLFAESVIIPQYVKIYDSVDKD